MSKFWFAGNGPFAAQCLDILAVDLDIDLVVTSFPKKGGRGMLEKRSPVQEVAEGRIPVHMTRDLSRDPYLVELLHKTPPTAIFVVDFSHLVREPFLSFSELGCLNIHPSLLPSLRGAAPVQRAILSGMNTTGVTVFKLQPSMDSGPILAQESCRITDEDTAGTLLTKLAAKGSILLLDALKGYETGQYYFRVQDPSLASYAPRIEKNEALLDWKSKANELHNKVRAFNPKPGAFFHFRGKRVKVWQTSIVDMKGSPGTLIAFLGSAPVVSVGDKSLILQEVQVEGKKKTTGSAWANGSRLIKGEMIK